MNDGVLKAFNAMKMRPVDQWVVDFAAVNWQLQRQIEMFPAWALPDLVKPTVICGIVHAHGVGEVWMVTGEGFEQTAAMVLGQQKTLCECAVKVLDLHRLHMLIDSDRKEAKRWAERIGFVREHGPLKRMGARANDLDMFLWKGDADVKITE